MLPEGASGQNDSSARYGLFAMEAMLNDMFKQGAKKPQLVFKVTGGGRVLESDTGVGTRNAAFVRDFLRQEGYAIESEDLNGNGARKVRFDPIKGRLLVQRVAVSGTELEEEKSYRAKVNEQAPQTGDLELF